MSNRDVLAMALHDAVCPDRTCDPQVMGRHYLQADALIAAGGLKADVVAKVILAHELNDWGYCACGDLPKHDAIWTRKTHAQHVAGAIETGTAPGPCAP